MRLLTSLDEGKMQQAGALGANNASHILLPVIGGSAKLSTGISILLLLYESNYAQVPGC
jgi:hypothetical protein